MSYPIINRRALAKGITGVLCINSAMARTFLTRPVVKDSSSAYLWALGANQKGRSLFALDRVANRVLRIEALNKDWSTFGRFGQEPESLSNAIALAATAEDKVWIVDGTNAKCFEHNGSFVRVVPIDGITDSIEISEDSASLIVNLPREGRCVSAVRVQKEGGKRTILANIDPKKYFPKLQTEGDAMPWNRATIRRVSQSLYAVAFNFLPLILLVDNTGRIHHQCKIEIPEVSQLHDSSVRFEPGSLYPFGIKNMDGKAMRIFLTGFAACPPDRLYLQFADRTLVEVTTPDLKITDFWLPEAKTTKRLHDLASWKGELYSIFGESILQLTLSRVSH